MSLLKKFPDLNYGDIRVIPRSFTFTQNLAGGAFVWAQDVQDVHPIQTGCFYLMEVVSFSADLDELVFQNALDLTTASYTEGFSLTVFKKLGNQVVNLSLLNFANYVNDLPINLGYQSTISQQREQDTSRWRINGRLNQTAEIVALGKTSVTLFIRSIIYEITNKKWVAKYFNHRDTLI